ncbi:MAG: type II toxin-antitoxin system toxin DNA ADP-ribosyl transferase DarT [Prevotella intermedia]
MENKLTYAFRITHIKNISHIAKCGIVKASSPLHDKKFVNIGDSQVIKLRKGKVVKGYHIGEYIPFYFGPRSPMLYVIQHGYNGVQRVEPEEIVYCVIKLDDLITDGIECIFTDGHALSFLTSFYTKDDLVKIDSKVKYDDVYSSQWNLEEDNDLKRRKEAELLIKDDLPAKYIKGYVVYNENARQSLIGKGINENMIVVKSNYYF